ncbi:MAG TPA: hypothetical protein VK152_01910, partial [Paludibacter sp.]|nr:hypothetical protein [Paludibacter sp.]
MNPSNKNISRVLLLAAISVISLAFVFRNNHANQPGVRKNNPTGSIPQTAVPGSGRPLGQHLQNRVKIAVPNPARQAGPLQPAGNAISNAPTRLTAYLASRQAGVIGLYDGNQSDNPADNIFSVTLDYQPTVNDKVWLTYRLAGVDENSGVACSVNDRLAFGGYLVKTDTATRRQRIQLNAAWMQKGENRIQFGLPEKADYGYRVSDLALEVEQGSNDAPVAVTTS